MVSLGPNTGNFEEPSARGMLSEMGEDHGALLRNYSVSMWTHTSSPLLDFCQSEDLHNEDHWEGSI